MFINYEHWALPNGLDRVGHGPVVAVASRSLDIRRHARMSRAGAADAGDRSYVRCPELCAFAGLS